MSVHVYAYAVHSVLMCTDLGLTAAGEPLSPMSDCRSKGLHYAVKYIREKRAAGVECLLCGLIGPLENLKKVACLPCFSESGDNAGSAPPNCCGRFPGHPAPRPCPVSQQNHT